MRKIITAILTVSVLLGASATAFAQDGDEPRAKFYNFDDMLIDGEFKKPDVMQTEAKERARFDRLSNLKKSFLPKVRETTEESALQ